jgi:tRNA A-37 threonylcarbamoyl transferase component Bud32
MDGNHSSKNGGRPRSAARKVDAVCDRFEAAWRAGRRPRIEAYLIEMPGPHQPVLIRGLLAVELEFRLERAERPEAREYYPRFPGHEGDIDAVFTASMFAPRSAWQRVVEGATGANDAAIRHREEVGAEGEPALPDPFPGEFRIRGVLGEGTFGRVWLADDLNLDCQVALKTMRFLDGLGEVSPVLAALRKEARFLAKLRHPHIVRVFTWRQAGEEHYLVLQFVPGGSLADRIKGGPLDWQQAARHIADVGEGLQEVHASGIIHRDIKPANILWDPHTDEAILTDFGISARLAEARTVAGTLKYMAPEALEGRAVAESDVYSLAATLYQLSIGEPPFPASTPDELRGQIERGLPVPDLRCAGLPESLERIIRAGMAPSPEHRPALRDFVARLRGALNQLMADGLARSTTSTNEGSRVPVGLRLLVSRQTDGPNFEPVAAVHPHNREAWRDMRRVPDAPRRVGLRTGDRVLVEVIVDRPGYVTVFNVGPFGHLNLLYPDDPGRGAPSLLQADRPLRVADVEMTPPCGRERLVAVWCRDPIALNPQLLLDLAGGKATTSGPYRSTREMARIRDSVLRLESGTWRATVLELDHEPRLEESQR